jgi:TonB family protein
MNSKRLLRITLTISILIHGMIILPRANFNPFTPAPKNQTIEVRYIKKDLQLKLQQIPSEFIKQDLMPKPEPFLRLDSKIIVGNRRAPLPYVEPADTSVGTKVAPNRSENNTLANDSAQAHGLPSFGQSQAENNKTLEFSKPIFTNPEMTAFKKKISLPAIEMAKIDNPSYISYYQIVREKIRRSAYQNYTHNETGEVYVSFIISNDGYLKDVHLVEEKTTVNDYLKDIALRSIRDASPFPNFPKELDYPQLSFNIIISFEIE